MRRPSRKPDYQIRIARERIGILLDLAGKSVKKHPERSRRYVQLARKIGMRYNVRMTKSQKRRICKYCNSYLVPGYNSRVRTDRSKRSVVVTCLVCRKITRYPYISEKGNIKE